MISENAFNDIKTKANEMKYSSIRYAEYDDLRNSEIICDDDFILLFDKHSEHINFAINDFKAMVGKISKVKGKVSIHFVPREYVSALEGIGFEIWAEFADHFNRDLQITAADLDNVVEIVWLAPDKCADAAEVSQKCKLQSRGFEGDEKEWLEEWFKEGNGVIVVEKDFAIVGICCVAVYDNGKNLWIRSVAVDPEHQGCKIGKTLIEQAISWGASKGAVTGFLATDLQNKNARMLFERYGFEQKSGEDAVEIQMIRR
ncbi:MAG: GNAT family N-acetyltransferase [Defluviitaleaceae bacterium]|nr:GNAT family N-acetyltransferase [Defluviitaleaceae bacterium]